MPKQLKTRKRVGKDLDEIAEDLRPEKFAKLTNQPVDPDLPGDGQFYCVQCSRYFISKDFLEKHRKTKGHKKRVKELNERPYSQKEAEAAGGVGSYVEFKQPAQSSLSKKKQYDSGIVC